MQDTIAAIATAPGIGGIGIVRVSGPLSLEIADRVFRGKQRQALEAPSHSLSYGWVADPESGVVVDEILLAVMHKPKTYTGEVVVEFQCHGGAAALKAVLGLVLKCGARAAEPGEFTRRAFLNGRIDLAQAEAVLDVVNAKSDESLGMAMRQMQGDLSRRVGKTREEILEVLAHLSGAADFCDDVEWPSREELMKVLAGVREDLDALLAGWPAGRVLREGIRVAIIGKPNVGKSSLLNALLRQDRAIVTKTPGTTRDVIEEMTRIKGVPIVISDTAGVRESQDEIERLGVERTSLALKTADVALVVVDDSRGIDEDDEEVLRMAEGLKRIVVVNKVDLGAGRIDGDKMEEVAPGCTSVRISALTGANLQQLEAELREAAIPGGALGEVLVAKERHKKAIEEALWAIEAAIQDIERGLPEDIAGLQIESGARALGKITGEGVSEEVLDLLFAEFCVGK